MQAQTILDLVKQIKDCDNLDRAKGIAIALETLLTNEVEKDTPIVIRFDTQNGINLIKELRGTFPPLGLVEAKGIYDKREFRPTYITTDKSQCAAVAVKFLNNCRKHLTKCEIISAPSHFKVLYG